jgi:spastin
MYNSKRPYSCIDDSRRFSRRIYIQLPDLQTRKQLLQHLLSKQVHSLMSHDFERIATYDETDMSILIVNVNVSRDTDGYSGSDLTSLAKDAAMGPVRELRLDELKKLSVSRIRAVSREDFLHALKRIRPSVASKTLNKYIEWNREFGDCSS